MIVFRKRLIYWLVREYLKKWGKIILIFFAVGLAIFFALLRGSEYFLPKIPVGKNETIGIVGAYKFENLPEYITKDISMGLTTLGFDGEPKPGIAGRWKIENDGKRYIFYLKSNIQYSDGSVVTSDTIQYNFSDVTVKRPNAESIIFELKDNYSPFLVTVSKPVFKKSLAGIGEYKIKNIELNGDFIQSLIIANIKNPYKTKTYQFYSSNDALKTAYMLGEVSKAVGLSDTLYQDTSLEKFPNTVIEKTVNDKHMVTLFYNTHDPVVSDKRLRSGLSYATSDTFSDGRRSYMPYPPSLWAYAAAYNYSQDIDRAKILLGDTEIATKSATLNLEIKTFPRYKKAAQEIAESWKKVDVKTKIITVESVPETFQIFLGDFLVSKDPDQYTLWHSAQPNNITRYENKRIDKLLEDGRKTVDHATRKKIYDDFQKYLTVDSPATFLYFPYEYEVRRK